MLHELPIDKALVGMFNATLPPVSLKACSCTKLMYVPPGLLTMRTPATSGQPPEAERLATDLGALGQQNRRLLEEAIALQSRVIETIAIASRPAGHAPGYGRQGRHRPGAQATALAVVTRA
jgi:hypothetical protein